MKKLICIVLVIIPFFCKGQEIEINGIYYQNNDADLSNIFGIGASYSHKIKEKKNIGLDFHFFDFRKDNDIENYNDADPDETFIHHTNEYYKIYSIRPFINWNISNTKKIDNYIGTNLSLFYYNDKWDEKGIKVNYGSPEYYNKIYMTKSGIDKSYIMGIGFYLMTKVKDIICNNVSIVFYINPVFNILGHVSYPDENSHDFGSAFTSINFKIGISYKLKSNKK